MLLSAICKMSANSRNRKRYGVLIDFKNVRRDYIRILSLIILGTLYFLNFIKF